MSPIRLLPPVLVTVLLIAGCGSSKEGEPTATATSPKAPAGASARSCAGSVAGTSELRVTGVGCDVGRKVVATWTKKSACAPTGGASRVSCSIYDGYRCLGATADRGVAISCARTGSSVAFIAARN